jgi:virginiamycin A acetyltransferase
MTANALGDTSANNYDCLINSLEACGQHHEALKFILEKERKHVSGLPYTRNYSVVNKYSVGKFTYGIPIVKDWHQGSTLKIGNFCSIAENVTIVLGGNHSIDWISSFPFGAIFDSVKDKLYKHPTISKGDVIIGNDVWLAMNVIILSGVIIGDGAVVAAGAVITKDVAPYTIVGGNPAKPLKKRFDDESIAKLLTIKWWDWDIAKIEKNLDLISSDNIKDFIEKYYTSCDETNE